MARFKAKVEPVFKRGVVFSTLLVHTRLRSTSNPIARRAIPLCSCCPRSWSRQNDTRSVYILSFTLLSLLSLRFLPLSTCSAPPPLSLSLYTSHPLPSLTLFLPHHRSKHTNTNTHTHTCNIGHIQRALNRRMMARVIYLKIVTVVKCKRGQGLQPRKALPSFVLFLL